jgi:hypothetical protein
MGNAKATERTSTVREIWHSDFLVETSVLGCAADDRSFYERLARQLHKMTAKAEYGRAWIPSASLEEMAATPKPRRQEVLGVVLNLYRELGDRLLLTGTRDEITEAEWAGSGHTVSRSFAHLEADLVTCARGNGIGTLLDEIGQDFVERRTAKRVEIQRPVPDSIFNPFGFAW